jgi:Sulfotransferase domain
MTRKARAGKLASGFLKMVSVAMDKAINALTLARTGGVNFFRVRYLDFELRPDDLFIVTYPRSGTTLLQMILYQALTDGSMDLEHISRFSPWFERCCSNGIDMESFPSPRIFKSHLPYRVIPKGARYVYVTRNGMDVAASYFHFYQSHMGFRGSMAHFFHYFLRGKLHYGSWFEHVAGWQAHRDDRNILFLRYEDLIADRESAVRTIASFCGIELSPGRLERILERSSFEFMKQHEEKFDHGMEMLLERGVRRDSFLRKGAVGDWTQHFDVYDYARFHRELEKQLKSAGVDPSTVLDDPQAVK